MMRKWLNYFKTGISRQTPTDGIDQAPSAKDPRAAIRQLLPFLRPHWRSGLLGALLILLVSLLAFPQPLINRYLVDDVILGRRLDLLPWVIALMVAVKLIAIGAETLKNYLVLQFEEAITLDIQKQLLEHTLVLPKAFFDRQEIGYLVSRVTADVGGLRWFFSGTVVYLVTNLVKFIGGLGFLFYLEWRLALVSLVVLPLMLITVRFFSIRQRALSHHGMETRARITQRVQETIASLPLIKSFSTEGHESGRVAEALRDGVQVNIEQNVVSTVAGLAINSMPDLVRGFVLVAGAYLAIRGDWTLGSLLAFQSYLGYVFGPAMFLGQMNLTMQSSLAALERVLSLFAIVPEPNLATGLEVNSLRGEITFEEVTFAYGSGPPVLEGLSFNVTPGQRVAIVGPSGVGKTTLVSLILCFYQPTSGEILFDDLPISDYNLPALRRRIGYVSQSTLLLSGTFRENLCYGNSNASQEDVEKAAKAAGIHDFITGLPQGYGSKIDERAVNLSEGQKQRLSIARALIKNPDILILDEPTAALDSIVERSIFTSLPRFIQGKTLFVVAHRLATIQDSDQILLLNERELVTMGTHAQLLAENPFYRELVANQQVIG